MAMSISSLIRTRTPKLSLFSYKRFHKGIQTLSPYRISELLDQENGDNCVKVQGWVQKLRKQKKWIFVDVIDGSTTKHLQLVINVEQCEDNLLKNGCAIEATGKLMPSIHPLQKVELHTDSVKVVGPCDALPFNSEIEDKQDRDYIRKYLHLRSKTKFFSSILQIRSEMFHAVHQFFKKNKFIQVHTPILSSNDCEGAGDTFAVQMTECNETNEKPKEHFFAAPTYLSVSGQLHLEAVVGGLSRVYCFNPAFRAENGISRRHLSEFYMLEAELAFCDDINMLMDVMEDMVKSVLASVLENCSDHLKIHQTPSHNKMLSEALSTPFIRLTYSEAFDCLLKHTDKLSEKPKKETGELSREQELLLVEVHNQIPVFVTDYPSNNKPFYMKVCEENPNNVKSVDLLGPYVGELCGGSLRETSITLLEKALYKSGQVHQLQWYLDLRKYGDAPHAGFGAGFERLLLLATGLKNIRDVMPFPRWAHNCNL